MTASPNSDPHLLNVRECAVLRSITVDMYSGLRTHIIQVRYGYDL